MNEKALCTQCGGDLCVHGHCPDCEPGVCDQCTEQHLVADDVDLGGEA